MSSPNELISPTNPSGAPGSDGFIVDPGVTPPSRVPHPHDGLIVVRVGLGRSPTVLPPTPHHLRVPHDRRSEAKAIVGLLTFILATIVSIPTAHATLPPWLQHIVGASTIESALYRLMSLPTVQALYPRPPKESQTELARLIAATPADSELYALRARASEAALDFPAAEADWKLYVTHAKDPVAAKLELANFYHRQLQIPNEVATLREVAAAPALPSERFTNPATQRSWLTYERLLALIADQALPPTETQSTYESFLTRCPAQPAVYARFFQFLLDQKNYPAAEALLPRFRQAFPQDTAFPIRAQALLEYRRGNLDRALAVYDQSFQPLWPADLVQSYFALLAKTHRQRAFVADARARLAAHPEGPEALNALARIFFYDQQQNHNEAAAQTLATFRIALEQRNTHWTPTDLYTLATLSASIQNYPEAARYYYALASTPGTLPNGPSGQPEPAAQAGLAALAGLLLTAPDQPIALGFGNLTLLRDIATLDQGPGYWNGILSLWLNGTSPQSEYNTETAKAQSYFHRAKAAELIAQLDERYPAAPERPALHADLLRAYAQYGESAALLAAGKQFLTAFPAAPQRLEAVNLMADAFARQNDTTGEFALYDTTLAELAAQLTRDSGGLPLTAAGPQPIPNPPGASSQTVPPSELGSTEANASQAPLTLGTYTPQTLTLTAAQAYAALLDRYVSRLVAANQSVRALAVLRRQLDLNPNDPLLYERLAAFLEQNNLSGEQEATFRSAIARFQQPTWYDKLARLYLRQRNRQAFAALTRQVTDIFSGTDLDQWFAQAASQSQLNQFNGPTPNQRSLGPQLALQLNLYAEQRFPHDLVFTRNLLAAYQTAPTKDSAAYEALLRRHWWEDEPLRNEFFTYLSQTNKLQPELAQLQTLIPNSGTTETLGAPSIEASSRWVGSTEANPAATRELAETQIWTSHFELAAPLLARVADLYPADPDLGDRAVSLFRSLSYLDPTPASLTRAVAIETRLYTADPADPDRLATLGDLYAEATSIAGEDLPAAIPYWRRIPGLHPGTPAGYLTAATIFWDYFQFPEALAQIQAARTRFHAPTLYAYEAGAIHENQRDLPAAVAEYTAAVTQPNPSGDTHTDPPSFYENDHGITGYQTSNNQARARLLQLATRPATRALVDSATARALAQNPTQSTALTLRADLLIAQHREPELTPLFDTALAKTTTSDEAAAIGALAQTHSLTPIYERSLQKQIALTADPVEKIQLNYTLAASLEARHDLPAATRVIAAVYQQNPRTLGVVRATTGFYARTAQPKPAIATLLQAAHAATPTLARSFTLEAAAKANDSNDPAQALALALTLLPATPYDPQILAIVAASYARAHDDTGLKTFYEAQLASVKTAPLSPDDRKQATALLRRGLIPALTRLNDPEGALNQYIALLSAFPEDSATAQEAGLYALRYSRHPQLVGFLRATVQQSPQDSRFAILLAQVDTTFEDLPGALAAYNAAIAVRKDRADLYQSRADLELRLGLADPAQLESAAADFTRLYTLTYHDPQWMVRFAELRARQRRPADAVRALQTAYLAGHSATAADAFKVAAQLADWNLLPEARTFAEQGLALAGPNLLLPKNPSAGSPYSADLSPAATYARILTRQGHPDQALATLAAARRAVDATPSYPADLAGQLEAAGISADDVTAQRAAYRKQRADTAEAQLTQAVQALGTTAAEYFTPEQKQALARTLDTLHATNPTLALAAATSAGLADREAAYRKQALLTAPLAQAATQRPLYLALQQSRLAFSELAQTLEAYAKRLPAAQTAPILTQAAQAYRDAADEPSELRLTRTLAQADNSPLRDRFLDLLLRHDPAALTALAAGSNASLADAALNYTLAHRDQPAALAAVAARARTLPPVWQPASASLVLTYFAEPASHNSVPHLSQPHRDEWDPQPFTQSLDSDATIATRLATPADPSRQLTGNQWFYYAGRYGIFLATVPKVPTLPDPEDFLPAELELSPTLPTPYAHLAQTYAESNNLPAAIAEYNHALELAPNDLAIHNSYAATLFPEHAAPVPAQRDQAIAQWRASLQILARMVAHNAYPETFYIGLASTLGQLGRRALLAPLRPEVESILRPYFARNGNYRSNELLQSAYEASATPAEGAALILSLTASANDPENLLADLAGASWLPPPAHRQLLLRRLQLLQTSSSATAENSRQQLRNVQRALLQSYLADAQYPPAQALVDALPTAELPSEPAFQTAALVLAAHAGRLPALLETYRATPDTQPPPKIFEDASNALTRPTSPPSQATDLANAILLRQYAFDAKQLTNTLLLTDFLALAQLRLDIDDLPAALQLLHRLAQLPGAPSQTASSSELGSPDAQLTNPYTNTDSAATLLESTHHPAEALPFLTTLVQSAPWNAAYKLRLARAQRDSAHRDLAAQLLTQIAADTSAPYAIRATAAADLSTLAPAASPFNSAELTLLASARPSVTAARQPYFATARIALAENPTLPIQDRIALLRESLALAPTGPAAGHARLTLLQLEAPTAPPSTVIALLTSMAKAPSENAASGSEPDISETEPDASTEGAPGSGAVSPRRPWGSTPLPHTADTLDLPTRIRLATQLASAYQRDHQPEAALGYLQGAVDLSAPNSNPTLLHQRDALAAAIDLDRRNALRRPILHPDLAQPNEVRPRLTQLAQAEAP